MTKVLVIEDARALREDIVEMLSLEGFEALGAENGRVGVELANKERPGLIVCDIMMPEKDGYEVLEDIRRNPHTATIPFIFLTAKTEKVNVRHGMMLGADDYLTKPFRIGELFESIQLQLKKRQELNEAANRRLEDLRKNIITALPHELRTPLNTIIGFSDIMVMEAQRLKPDQVASWATHINVAAHRLYRLVENYLYYVRLQVAAETDEPLNKDGERIVEIRSLVEAEAQKQAMQSDRLDDLKVDIKDDAVLDIAFQDLNKIVTELIDNAFKFSEKGEGVCVSGHAVDDGIYEIVIQDHGRGITDEQANNIGAYMQFERWLYEQQGMGLGLAVIKDLMALHGGELYLNGEADQGTIARVLIRTV